MVCFDCYWSGALSDRCLQRFLFQRCDDCAITYLECFVWVIIMAGSFLLFVGVLRLSCDPMVNDIEHRVLHVPAIASHIAIRMRAVHQLLFWKWGQIATFLVIKTFEWSGGRKCPAWSALTLIFDTGYSSYDIINTVVPLAAQSIASGIYSDPYGGCLPLHLLVDCSYSRKLCTFMV